MKITIKELRTISKKNARIPIRHGGRSMNIPSKAFRRFEKEALEQIGTHKPLKGNLDIDIVFYMKGKLDTDIDNMVSSIFDVLEKAGCYENDKQITSLTATKIAGQKDWLTEIDIVSL